LPIADQAEAIGQTVANQFRGEGSHVQTRLRHAADNPLCRLSRPAGKSRDGCIAGNTGRVPALCRLQQAASRAVPSGGFTHR